LEGVVLELWEETIKESLPLDEDEVEDNSADGE